MPNCNFVLKTVHVVREAKGAMATKLLAYRAVLRFERSVQNEIAYCFLICPHPKFLG